MRKLLGAVLGVFSLCNATLFIVAVGDLLSGGGARGPSMAAALAVFFGGLMTFSGLGARRLFASRGAAARADAPAPPPSSGEPRAAASRATTGIDIELEARVLAMAAQHDGRVTVTEVALGCGVPLERAEATLDGLLRRDHADLQVTPDGDKVYVVRGFLSAEEKQRAHELTADRT